MGLASGYLFFDGAAKIVEFLVREPDQIGRDRFDGAHAEGLDHLEALPVSLQLLGDVDLRLPRRGGADLAVFAARLFQLSNLVSCFELPAHVANRGRAGFDLLSY